MEVEQGPGNMPRPSKLVERDGRYVLIVRASGEALAHWRRVMAPVPDDAVDDRLLTPDEAAEYLSVSPATLRRWKAAGKVTAIQVSERSVRYRRADLEQALAAYARWGVRRHDRRGDDGDGRDGRRVIPLRSLEDRIHRRTYSGAVSACLGTAVLVAEQGWWT